MKEGASAPFFCSAICGGVRISGHCILWPLRAHSRPAAAAALVPPSAGAYSWAAQGRYRVPLPPSVPAWLASLWGRKAPSRRHCPALALLAAGLKRYAGPAAPLALAACGSAHARRCAWLRAAVWRGSIRALPCGAARGPARSGGARRPLALGGGCAAACRRGWRGLALAALRLGLRVLALAPLRPGGVGPGPAPSGLRAAPRAPPAALLSRLRSRRGARGSRASPSLAAPACPAPRRRVALGLSQWCACGRGDGDSAACGRRG